MPLIVDLYNAWRTAHSPGNAPAMVSQEETLLNQAEEALHPLVWSAVLDFFLELERLDVEEELDTDSLFSTTIGA